MIAYIEFSYIVMFMYINLAKRIEWYIVLYLILIYLFENVLQSLN